MIPLPALSQLPIGFGVGLLSALVPGLFRPFIALAVLLLGVEGAVLYRAGGMDALASALAWLVPLARNATLLIAGLGLGRWAGEVVFGRL